MIKIIGKCSECGGHVMVPDVWMGIIPPVPTCSNCGAKASDERYPVIKMQPKRDTK